MKHSVLLIISLFLFSLSVVAQDGENHLEGKEIHEHINGDTSEAAAPQTVEVNDGHSHQEGQENHEGQNTKKKASFDKFPTLHPLVVHFPIVLLLFAALFQIISFFVFKEQLSWVTLGIATVGLLGAYIAGSFVHPHTEGLSESAAWLLEKHELFADYTLWSALIAVVLKSVSHFFLKGKLWLEILVAVALVFSAYSVSEAGHYGAQLIHIEGVGAKGEFLETGEHSH